MTTAIGMILCTFYDAFKLVLKEDQQSKLLNFQICYIKASTVLRACTHLLIASSMSSLRALAPSLACIMPISWYNLCALSCTTD